MGDTMSTAVAIPIGHVPCGCSNYTLLSQTKGCHLCDWTGHILDPRIAEWSDPGTTPARMIELLGARADLAAWAQECDRVLHERQNQRPSHAFEIGGRIAYWSSTQAYFIGCCIQPYEAAAFLRCLFANPNFPREMVECHCCKGSRRMLVPKLADDIWDAMPTSRPAPRIDAEMRVCDQCQNGYVPAPRILPGWKSSRVLDLARAVRGGFTCSYCGNWKPDYLPEKCLKCEWTGWRVEQPQPIHNFLADALQDDGCDDAELLRHLYDGPHVDGQCWVIDLILNGG